VHNGVVAYNYLRAPISADWAFRDVAARLYRNALRVITTLEKAER
jgi:hypothetical protein